MGEIWEETWEELLIKMVKSKNSKNVVEGAGTSLRSSQLIYNTSL